MPGPVHHELQRLTPLPDKQRLEHVRACSLFASGQIDRHPGWLDDLQSLGRLDTDASPPDSDSLEALIAEAGLDAGLRRFRNREMLRIIWRDLCGVSGLRETLADVTRLAELCLDGALSHHQAAFRQRHGTPRDDDGHEQGLVVIGMGKLGGGELNLSSDIDIILCYPKSGSSDGPRCLSNDQYFIRLTRAMIRSLSEMTADGFCYRVDTRLRPFGESGPLCCSFGAMEQYYQRDGRDWERYALIKARPVAGDRGAGDTLLAMLKPFVYRRYIDYGAVEALRDMRNSVEEDAARKDRLDDIKRGPGGIREIEFLVQGYQLLRGGREPALQTPSLHEALEQLVRLGLLGQDLAKATADDYRFLRDVENRIQAQRDQQTHTLPTGEDLDRLVRAMHQADESSPQSADTTGAATGSKRV